MTRMLEPCPSCRRHVAIDEARCPMCGVELGASWAMPRPIGTVPRTGRAVRFAWRLLLATSTTACGARTPLTTADAAGASDSGRPSDAGAPRDSGLARDGGRDAGRLVGGDGGMDAEIDGGDTAIYGAPPLSFMPSFPEDVAPPPTPARIARKRRKRKR